MSITSPITEAMSEKLAKTLERVRKGERDPEALKLALAAADRSREETRKRVGILNVCVDLIRDARNQ